VDSYQALAVNNVGTVVGIANEAHPVAVAWANGVITKLGDLDGAGHALALNDRDIIVGYYITSNREQRAILWNKIGGAPQDLNTLIAPSVQKTLLL
jgi:probable HAF family extracellular repeat protein